MTIPVWPSSLPNPERNTWNGQHQDVRGQRQTDAGVLMPGRPRFSRAAKLVSLSVVLERDQKAVFDNFFERDTKRGSLLFWMPDPTTDRWALLASDGSPLIIAGGANDGKPLLMSALWLCSFGKELPSEAVLGIQFRMSFSVVVAP